MREQQAPNSVEDFVKNVLKKGELVRGGQTCKNASVALKMYLKSMYVMKSASKNKHVFWMGREIKYSSARGLPILNCL